MGSVSSQDQRVLMDPTMFKRRLSPLKSPDRAEEQSSPVPHSKSGFTAMKAFQIFATFLIALPFLIVLSVFLGNAPADRFLGFSEARVLERTVDDGASSDLGSTHELPHFMNMSEDNKLMGGLILPGFDEGSCLSRYQSSSYRKKSPYKPSPYLLSRLRSYETLHKQCGPGTSSYGNALKELRSNRSLSSTECQYLVWISFSGLGNRILALTSAFLYALLTNRVLLVDPGKDMVDLFCEPFPDRSWFLPNNFPLQNQFDKFDQKSSHCHGNMLKQNTLGTSTDQLPSYLYLHLVHDYDDQDKLFFCDQDQAVIEKVGWLVMKTDNYFVPSLFLMPSFEQELSKLFPEKDTVFHHLGRYLFHPTNHVWGLITRYYQAYLSKSDKKIGIQVRIFEDGLGPFQHVIDQILRCVYKENLLPEVDKQGSVIVPSKNPRSISVLMTSLNSGYYEKFRTMYWEDSTVTGDVVGVYQPSHEQFQQTEKRVHNRKAWAEMYLLSLTDTLVTSAWSTFGYVAHGLGGLKPRILFRAQNKTVPDPPCLQVMSMEPCFHAPPFYDCKAKKGIDTGKLVPHVRHCEDISWGLKLVDDRDGL